MAGYRTRLACVAIIAFILATLPSYAKTGVVRVVVTKAGFVAGAGAGRGTLTFDGREYRFSISGLSVGLTFGASTNHLVGRAMNLHQLSDFPGTYAAVGGGGALLAGGGVVQLKNENGVVIRLRGVKAGLEFSASMGTVRIALD
jgi:hypothetical protein